MNNSENTTDHSTEGSGNPGPDGPAHSAPAGVTAALAGGAFTTIEVIVDVGSGNAVFLRGSGGGLKWECGVPLDCVNCTTWRWVGMLKYPLSFKPLLNDYQWSTGNDFVVYPGQKLEVKPTFV